jgi:hypothetical protein
MKDSNPTQRALTPTLVKANMADPFCVVFMWSTCHMICTVPFHVLPRSMKRFGTGIT